MRCISDRGGGGIVSETDAGGMPGEGRRRTSAARLRPSTRSGEKLNSEYGLSSLVAGRCVATGLIVAAPVDVCARSDCFCHETPVHCRGIGRPATIFSSSSPVRRSFLARPVLPRLASPGAPEQRRTQNGHGASRLAPSPRSRLAIARLVVRPTVPPPSPPSPRASASPQTARPRSPRSRPRPPRRFPSPSQDPTLEAIKQKRLAELGGAPGGMPQSAEEQQAQQAEAEARAEQRREALATLMDAKARERLSRIRLVKPDKATALENMLLQAAQRGQLGGVVTEDALIKMLEQVNGGAAGGGEGGGRGGPKITMARRRDIMDDDDW